jgi:hypothetical protein
VGFDAPGAGGTVTGGDAVAWPEVLFDDLGWVAFDPLPKSDEAPRPVEDDFTPKPSKAPPTSDPPTATDTPSASAPPLVAAPPARGRGGPSTAVVASGAGGSVVLMRRGLRRRRLTTGAPGERITGAWFEFTDALRLAGRPVPDHLAATEAAAFAATAPPPRRRPARRTKLALRRSVPPDAGEARSAQPEGDETRLAAQPEGLELPPLGDLVSAVNTVAFAPGAATPEQADRAGAQAVAYADALRETRPWWRRAWWSVHPGPLRWHPDAGSKR